MRSIRNICRHRGLLMTLAFIASLLEWIVIVHSENTKSSFHGIIPEQIKMPIGGNANITCHVPEGENSSSVYFFEKNFNTTIYQPHKDIIKIDDKTVILTIHNATRHIFQYHCRIGEHNVNTTEVFVGSPPGKVKDFTCRAYDFQYMTCTFTKPQNFIYTEYDLHYTIFPNTPLKTCMDRKTYGNQYTYNLTLRNDSFYVAMANTYYFNITGRNELGNSSQIEIINHYDNLIPGKFKIQVENITTDSVILTWKIDQYSNYKHANITLDYEIKIKPKDLKDYFATDYEYCNERKCCVLINNLKYAYYNYSLSVRAKVKQAQNIDNMWSEPSNTTFRTKAKKPDYPPSTVPGSFYMGSHLYLYWQELKEYEYNGPGFHYDITEMRTNGNFSNTTTTRIPMAVLQWNEDGQKEHIYYIRAVNNFGHSSNSSITVFSDIFNKQDYKANFVTKKYENNTYILSWKSPKEFQNLTNYTIFWCTEKIATINRCSGTIHFAIIDKYSNTYKLSSNNEPLNLAVSANYKNYTTGMNWACNADESLLVEVQPEAIPLAGGAIKVFWSLDRICSSIIQGYNLTYCQTQNDAVLSEKPVTCITDPITLRLKGDLKNITISLNPNSKYLLNMLMYSNKTVGPRSDVLLVETKEAAPTSPRNLTIVKLTSQSITISWLPPKKFNGKLQYYTIYAESKESKLASQLNVSNTITLEGSNNPLNYTINDLKDSTEYKVYVRAHTVEPSPPSESITVKTLIGKLHPPRLDVKIEKGNEGVFNWTEPLQASGRLEFYEVAILVKSSDNKTIEKIITTKNNNCHFREPKCHGSDFHYFLKVRAVYAVNKTEIDSNLLPPNASESASDNTDQIPSLAKSLYLECQGPQSYAVHSQPLIMQTSNEVKLPSSWETAPEIRVYNCQVKSSTFSSIAIIIVFIALLVISYGGCKKYKKMNNIDVVLPPGLVDHLSAYKINSNVSYGNKIDREQSDLSRSNDCLVNNKENFHLLSSLSPNSGNRPNGMITIVENSAMDKSFNFERDYNYAFQREETSNGSYDDQNSSKSTDSIEINDLSSVSYSNGPLYSDTQLSNEAPQNNNTTIPALNGYVSVASATNANSGYITADRINSFQTNFLQNDESKKNLNDINPNSSNNMYVTPAQLAQLGRSERLH